MAKREAGFFVAPFSIDGELIDVGYWELQQLSHKWLTLSQDFLRQQGDSFDASWGGPLAHIRIKFTARSGVALETFFVHDRPAASVAMASGRAPAAECQVLRLFVDSLRRVEVVRAAAQSQEPFAKALVIAERPILFVVFWADPSIDEQDHELVKELTMHMAGAFFGPTPSP
jgi:hypothetical protein